MTTLLSLIGPQAIGVLAGFIALLGVYIRGRLTGANLERNKHKAKEADAYEKHLQDIADAGNARPSGSVSVDGYNRDRR